MRRKKGLGQVDRWMSSYVIISSGAFALILDRGFKSAYIIGACNSCHQISKKKIDMKKNVLTF